MEEKKKKTWCNRMGIIAPTGPRVGVRPRVINCSAGDGASVPQSTPLTNLIMTLNCEAPVEGPRHNAF